MPEVVDIRYNQVSPSPGLVERVEESDMVIIGPSNPITSIWPIISIEGMDRAPKKSYVVGISPIIGDVPVSGPAAKFMNASRGHRCFMFRCSKNVQKLFTKNLFIRH